MSDETWTAAKAATATTGGASSPDSPVEPTALRIPYEKLRVTLFVARLVVGGMFVYLALKKIAAEPGDFVLVLKEYSILPLTPPHLINGTAVILPWFEVLAGLALMAGRFLRGASFSVAALLFVFTTAILWRALHFPDYVSGAISFTQIRFDCGCGAGPIDVWEKIAENTLLLFITLPVLMSALRAPAAK